MPQTAAERGLADPFDPEQAIPQAARFLADLRRQFGSLGIAAAAYNAGPARVANWLRGESDLPAETRAYVRFITEAGIIEAAPVAAAEANRVAEHDNALVSGMPTEESCLAVTAE
jgi:soluble lytic murein transglycosylase-like protein